MSIKKLWAAATAFVVFGMTTIDASAEPGWNTPDDQYVEFEDADPLSAEAAILLGDTVTGRIDAGRVTLIRPRTSFVDALYKSIEHI